MTKEIEEVKDELAEERKDVVDRIQAILDEKGYKLAVAGFMVIKD